MASDDSADVASGTYRGRLMADGQGNLLADESERLGDRQVTTDDGTIVSEPIFRYGENHGKPVAEHEGSYVFVNAGEASHNDRHHRNLLEFAGTTDESAEGESHHLEPASDDPHYDADTENHTRLRFSPDAVAATETGHTDAYIGQSDSSASKGDAPKKGGDKA